MTLNKPFEINVYVISIDPFEITYTLISKGLLNVIEIGGLDELVEFFVMHFKTVKQQKGTKWGHLACFDCIDLI